MPDDSMTSYMRLRRSGTDDFQDEETGEDMYMPPDDSTNPANLSFYRNLRWFDWVPMGASALTVFCCLMALMIDVGSLLGGLAMCLGIFVALGVFAQRLVLLQFKTLREVHNQIRQEANVLQEQNQELQGSVTSLETKVEKLRAVENNLQNICDAQGSSTTEFMTLLDEQREIIAEMHHHLEAEVVQNLLTAVMKSDRDRDFIIDPEEIRYLMLRLEHSSAGIVVHEDAFKALLERKGYNLGAVLDVCKKLMNKDESDGEEQVIEIQSRKLCFAQI
mmetsp:Transcript_9100/g.14107  ORF Transcript_9100/g.14107 Transcript_9100/m.14107 type:complete len:276 (+) Transcript_9100:195-1022(+)